jgi:hypothetical protein
LKGVFYFPVVIEFPLVIALVLEFPLDKGGWWGLLIKKGLVGIRMTLPYV